MQQCGDLGLNLYVAARFPEEEELAARVRDATGVTTFAVTVNGTTRTATMTSAGKQITSHLFAERDEVLDVQVVATAGNAANEAPSIEAIRVYARDGNHRH